MSDFDMERICRLCCEQKDRMRSLFGHRPNYPLSLCQMIYAVAQLEIDPDDGTPKKICKLCVNTLIKMYKTIGSYWENDSKLKKQLNQSKPDESDFFLRQIVVEEDCNRSKLLELVPMNDTAEDDDHDEGRVTDTDVHVKDEPLDENDGDSSVTVTKQTVAIQENEAMPKRKRTRPHRKADEHRSTELVVKDEPQDENDVERNTTVTNQITAVQKNEPMPKRKRGRPFSSVKANLPKLNDHKCYICKSGPHESAVALLAHMNSTHSDLLPFTCTECVMKTVVLDSVLTLNVHLRRHLNPEKCLYCDKRFLSKSKVAIHVQRQHPSVKDNSIPRPVECDQCGKEYPSKAYLMQHVKLKHSASPKASCTICGDVFNGGAKLRSHMHKQHSVKNFECNICQRKVTSLKILQSHLSRFHSDTSRRFECSYCPETFSMKVLKVAHEKKTHTQQSAEPSKTETELNSAAGHQRRRGRSSVNA